MDTVYVAAEVARANTPMYGTCGHYHTTSSGARRCRDRLNTDGYYYTIRAEEMCPCAVGRHTVREHVNEHVASIDEGREPDFSSIGGGNEVP